LPPETSAREAQRVEHDKRIAEAANESSGHQASVLWQYVGTDFDDFNEGEPTASRDASSKITMTPAQCASEQEFLQLIKRFMEN